MKNTINISNNVNLILNTYRCLFFQTASENLRCCSTASTMPCKTSQQDKAAWKWKDSGICDTVLVILHLGLLRISLQHRYIVQTSLPPFLPSFLFCYLFSKCNIHFFILFFSDPTLFCLYFPVFCFPCLLRNTFLLSFFACPLLSLPVFLVSLLLSFLLPSIFLL